MAEAVVADTHVLLWWASDPGRLSAPAAREIESAEAVLASPIAFWELTMLVGKDRIALDRPIQSWVNDLLACDGVVTAELTPRISVAAAALEEFHGDPADRFIAATALVGRVPLVTKDRKIHDWADQTDAIDCIW